MEGLAFIISLKSRKTEMSDICAFCGRSGAPKTHGHHVIPKCRGGKEIAPTCGACGSFIHATWSHNELRDVYNTVEKVVADPRYQKFVKWLRKQPVTTHFKTERRNGRAKGKYK
jgi:hypothetical protein